MPAGGLSCGAGVAVCCAGEAQVLLAPVGAADDLRQNRLARTYRARPLDHGQTEAVDNYRSAAGPTPLLLGPAIRSTGRA